MKRLLAPVSLKTPPWLAGVGVLLLAAGIVVLHGVVFAIGAVSGKPRS